MLDKPSHHVPDIQVDMYQPLIHTSNRIVCCTVLQIRAVMSYLQVVGEQHKLVEQHMNSFTALITELQQAYNLQVHTTEVSVCANMHQRSDAALYCCNPHCQLAGWYTQHQGHIAVFTLYTSYTALMPVSAL